MKNFSRQLELFTTCTERNEECDEKDCTLCEDYTQSSGCAPRSAQPLKPISSTKGKNDKED